MKEEGILNCKKGGTCHFLPESSYSTSLAVNKEREAPSVARVNPPAVDGDVAAEHSGHATFSFAKTSIHKHPFDIMASLTTGGCVALLQQISPKLTGQRALSFFKQMQKDRRERHREMPLKGVMNSKFSRCKYS